LLAEKACELGDPFGGKANVAAGAFDLVDGAAVSRSASRS
jgi:hypothetical protein